MVRQLALLPHSKKVLSSNPPMADWGQGLFVLSLHVLLTSAWVLSGFTGFLPRSKDMHDGLIGNFKLPVGVNVSGCLSLCVNPVMNWRLVQGVPRLLSNVSWDRLRPPTTPNRIRGYGK